MRFRTFSAVVSTMLLVGLAGCGGDATGGDTSKSGGDAASKPNSAEARKLLDQTLGRNPRAKSGEISAELNVVVKGLEDLREPISVSVVGPFNTGPGGVPEAALDLSLHLRGGILGGDLYLKGDKAYIGLGSTAYLLPADITGHLRRPLANRENALSALMGVFRITPRRWVKNPRIVGREKIAGIETIHGTAGIDTKRFFLDVAAGVKQLTELRVTEITRLPRAIDRRARAALHRSVKEASGDLYTGVDDKVMRRAKLHMLIKPSARDRKILGGFTSIKVDGTIDVTDVGTPQEITVPARKRTWADLQVAIDALAEAVRG